MGKVKIFFYVLVLLLYSMTTQSSWDAEQNLDGLKCLCHHEDYVYESRINFRSYQLLSETA